jgi:hypothetical protein
LVMRVQTASFIHRFVNRGRYNFRPFSLMKQQATFL